MSTHGVSVPGWLEESYLTTILQKSTPNAEVLSIDAKPGSAVGDNYCCQIFRLKVTTKIDNKQETLSIIAKITPDSKIIHTVTSKVDIFDTEARFFNFLLPKMGKFTDMSGVAPKVLHVDYENKAIFMEDLKESGYELQSRGKFLTLEQVLLAVEALALFHGTSWKVLEEDPNVKNSFLASFWEGELDDMSKSLMENTQTNLTKYADGYGLPEHLNRQLLQYSERFLDENRMAVFKRCDTNLNVILHGDCWMNNMLFRFNQTGIADDCKLLDFQVVYHGNFAHDLQYLLFSSAETSVILKNLDLVLETYYLKLKEVAPQIPNLSLERVVSDFRGVYLMGYDMLLSFRSFINGDTPPDMDTVLAGGTEEMGFNHPRFIKEVQELMPMFEKVGIFD